MVPKQNKRSSAAGSAAASPAARKPARRSLPADRAERRATDKRRAILRAAATVFRRRGFAATGMREIADAADISATNLYYYFTSKHELLYFCQEHSLTRMRAAVDEARAARTSLADTLRQVIRAHARCMLDELDGAAAHLEVDGLPPELRSRVVAGRDKYERAVRRLVADGVATGTFAPCDPALVTRAIFGALNWTARWYRPDGVQSAAAIADAFADYLVRGLLP